MQLWIIVKIALRGLLANKLRSMLTMLGVIIGVGAVIAMLAIGEGTKRQQLERIESFGVTTLTLRPGLRGNQGARTDDAQTLTFADGEAILRELPNVIAVAPEYSGTAQVVCANRNTFTRIVGTTPEYFPTRAYKIEFGRMFDHSDVTDIRQYAVLGPKVVSDLFDDNQDPVGQTIKIRGKLFTVIGVTASKGDMGFFNPDDQIFVPISVSQKRLFGTKGGASNSVQSLHIRVDAGGPTIVADMFAAQAHIEKLMRERHKIPPGEASDFNIRNMAESLKQSEETNRTFTLLLSGVAGISLLVGGIGIMNIMLVTVTERTREIGIRKSLGARPWDILKQFVIEAVVVSVLGGLLGIGIGLGVALGLPYVPRLFKDFPQFATAPTMESVVLSFAFAAAVGVFFGYYPARKAAKMDPIEALRYE